MKRYKVSCIIPARNEAERIGNVLSAVINHPLLDEIIVVQTFSTDSTSQVVRNFIKKHNTKKVKLLEDNKYTGKAYAMYLGVEKSRYPLLLFLDADLKGLNSKNIDDLVLPVMKDDADLTVAYFAGNSIFNPFFKIDPFCGQRAVKKYLFMNMPDYRYSKYGIESLQNEFFIKTKKRIRIVKMPNVTQKMKYKKHGFFKGWYYEIVMTKQVLNSVSLFKLLKIFIFFYRKTKRG